MNRVFFLWTRSNRHFNGNAVLGLCALLFCSSFGLLAQSNATSLNANASFSVRVTHLLGFEDTKSNCNGTLSIQGDALQFQQAGRPGAQVNIASIRDVSVGAEGKQIGGLPMKLGKTAAPYGAGRVVSLFAHKDYDTLTVEYVDSDGGIHGAIFQLNKGQGEPLRNELVARGVSPSPFEGSATKQSVAEAAHENK